MDVGNLQARSEAFDVGQEAHIVQSIMASPPAGLIYVPADATAGGISVKPAISSGVSIANVDAQLKDPSAYTTYVGSHGVAGAKQAAELLAKQIGETGQVAAIGVIPANPITAARTRGFREGIKEFHNVQLVTFDYPELDVGKIAADAAALLTKYPNIKGFYATNSLIAQAIGTALRADEQARRQAGPEDRHDPDQVDTPAAKAFYYSRSC